MNIFISLSVIFWSLFPSLISYTQGNELPQKNKLTNLVSNGDLLNAKLSPNQNEAFGFIYTSDIINKTLIDGVATFTANVQLGRMQQLITYTDNSTIYYFASVKTTSLKVAVSNNYTKGSYHSGNNTYQLLSLVYKNNPATQSVKVISLRDDSASGFLPIEVDYFGVINLTAVFGVGNEPSKAFMDSLINDIGYFEGDYYFSTSLDDNYKWFRTGFVDKTGERDFLDYLGFFVWLAVPPISIYLLYKLMKGVIYE